MRYPANSARHFMTELINTMNSFFKKTSNNHIQFQLSEQYLIPKKVDAVGKTKVIKKDAKKKAEVSAERQKLLKKGLKKFKEAKGCQAKFIQSTKELSQKERAKWLKTLWKGLSEEEKMKWCSFENKKKKPAAKPKQKAAVPRSGPEPKEGQKEQK